MRQIGPYRIEEELGRGGMATVYRVTDPQGVSYALKLLHQGPSQDSRWGTRFRREFRLLSRLQHAHLIQVHDYGEDEFQAYYVMDYIDGTTLWKFYRDELRGKSVYERLLWLIPLISQIVSALDYIHHHRVIHKDLKPANILLDHKGENAYLADFGLARDLKDNAQYTHPGFMGTLGYSAPEIIDRGRLDGRADIYSLGVILYTLIADRRPIQVEGRSFEQLLLAIREEEPVPLKRLLPDIHPDVHDLIHRCIQKDPSKRYRDTRELWQDLLPLLETFRRPRPQEAPKVPTPPRLTALQDPLFESVEAPGMPQMGLVMESKLVGRNHELGMCQALWSAIQNNGQNAALLLYGIAGIGKSFLLEELQRRLQRTTSHAHILNLRPNSPPYGSLAEALYPLLAHLPPAAKQSLEAQLLGQYLPGLQELFPPPKISAGPLSQPIQQLAGLVLALLMQFPADHQMLWLIDDLQHADRTSQEIFAHVVLGLLARAHFAFLFIATVGYQPDAPSPVRIPTHPQIEHHTLQPLTEEEESRYVSDLLGRPPNPIELHKIRELTRGLPLRTFEILQQGALFAQGAGTSTPSVESATSADVMSSAVSTAIHDLSAFHDSLRTPRHSLEEERATPSHSSPLFRTFSSATDLSSQRVEVSEPSDSFVPFSANDLQSPLFDEFSAPLDEQVDIYNTQVNASHRAPTQPELEAIERLHEAIESESTFTESRLRHEEPLFVPIVQHIEPLADNGASEALFQPDGDHPATMQMESFNPENTVMMMAIQPNNAHTLEASSVDNYSERTSVQNLPPLLELIEEASEEGIDTSSQAEEEAPAVDPSEQTILQKPITPGSVERGGLSTMPDPLSAVKREDLSSPLLPKTPPPHEEQDEENTENQPLTPSQVDLQKLAENSEEMILIPLFHRRLEMLNSSQRLRFAITAFLTEEFSYQELREAIQSPPEEALDLLNSLLSLRLLKTHTQHNEEYYSHLHPIIHRLLLAEIPHERWAELALRAAKAMSDTRESHHRQNNAHFLAMKFTEGGDPINSFRWQLYAVVQAFQSNLNHQLKESLKKLQQILYYWIERDAKLQMIQAFPQLLESIETSDSILQETGQQLLLVGLLYVFDAKDTAEVQSQKARQLLRQLLHSLPGPTSPEFQAALEHLQPLLQFARLRIRKKS